MPIINSITTQNLDKSKKEVLKSELAEIMQDAAGKSEDWLMVRFTEGDIIYFKGQELADGAIIEIKLVGKLNARQKKDISEKVCDIYNRILGYKKSSIYIVMQEVSGENWGWNGSTF